MSTPSSGRPWRRSLIQRRVSPVVDQERPHRWNWSAILNPLDRSLAHQTAEPLDTAQVRNLRFFWLDGLFAAISENFYLSFVVLFALAYGANNSQVGWVTAMANLLGALALFPGAMLLERLGQRKSLVVWSGGGVARAALLALALVPLITARPFIAILLIVGLNGLRALAANLGNPAWTALVADLVPERIRGRFFSSRNTAMGLAALLVAPLAGRLIALGNNQTDSPVFGYQFAFLLAFAFGMVSTLSFGRIREPVPQAAEPRPHHRGDLRRALRQSPGYRGLVVSAFVWNLGLQVAAPFFNVYLVNELGATTTMVGLLAAVSSLTALVGQAIFGRALDRKDAIWVQQICGFLIPGLPLAWIFITAPWHVAVINTFGGFLWAGYNLSNFALLLSLTPQEQRARAVALYQTAVFGSAVAGPLLGGWLADNLSFAFIFGLSGAGRMAGMLLFLFFTVRPLRASQRRLA